MLTRKFLILGGLLANIGAAQHSDSDDIPLDETLSVTFGEAARAIYVPGTQMHPESTFFLIPSDYEYQDTYNNHRRPKSTKYQHPLLALRLIRPHPHGRLRRPLPIHPRLLPPLARNRHLPLLFKLSIH